jgi:hypothetical protein
VRPKFNEPLNIVNNVSAMAVIGDNSIWVIVGAELEQWDNDIKNRVGDTKWLFGRKTDTCANAFHGYDWLKEPYSCHGYIYVKVYLEKMDTYRMRNDKGVGALTGGFRLQTLDNSGRAETVVDKWGTYDLNNAVQAGQLWSKDQKLAFRQFFCFDTSNEAPVVQLMENDHITFGSGIEFDNKHYWCGNTSTKEGGPNDGSDFVIVLATGKLVQASYLVRRHHARVSQAHSTNFF